MRQKKLVIMLLVLLAFVVSGFTYAYWASSITVGAIDNQQATITIGEGQVVNTSAAVGLIDVNGEDLVPTAYASGDEDTAVITIPVTWTSALGASGALGTLTASNPVLTTDGDVVTTAQLNAMFSVTLTTNNVSITNGATEDVVITIVFANEPATLALYEALQTAGQIILTVSLVITPAS